jgi:hypothetical protein
MTAAAQINRRTTATPGQPTRPRFNRRKRRDYLTFIALALPNVILIAVFTYRPLIMNVYYSTLDWTLGSRSAVRIGLANYIEFFTSPDSLGVLATTAIFTVATVGGSMILGLLVALALNTRVAGRGFARAAVSGEDSGPAFTVRTGLFKGFVQPVALDLIDLYLDFFSGFRGSRKGDKVFGQSERVLRFYLI